MRLERLCFLPAQTPELALRRLGPDEAAQIGALYRPGGRDGAWASPEAIGTLLRAGAWWGGFADGALCFCAARAPAQLALEQVAALRGACAGLPPPDAFLLPPAASPVGCALSQAFLPPLCAQAPALSGAAPRAALMAAVPVRADTALLAGCFGAGLAAVRVRPLAALRPHYLLVPRQTTPAAPPRAGAPRPSERPVRTVYLPLADTRMISRLLECGFCGTALCRDNADRRVLMELQRPAAPE